MKHPERPPVIEASEKTAFIYRIEGGMDDRDMDEMEAMDSGYVLGRNWPTIVSESVDIGHRMRYMRKRGLGFRFLRMEDRAFEDTLWSYDPDMPEILAWMVSDAYLNGTCRASDILDNIESVNPLGYDRPRANGTYRKKVVGLLSRYSEGAEDYVLKRTPVGRLGCAEIWKTAVPSYEMRLILHVSALRRTVMA